MSCSAEQFFSVNRFFFDILISAERTLTLKDISLSLNISYSFVKKILLQAKFPRRIPSLIQIAKSIELHVSAPPIYKIIKDSINSGVAINSLYVEHFKPGNAWLPKI